MTVPPLLRRRIAAGVLAALFSVVLLGSYTPFTADIGPGKVQLSADWDWSGVSRLSLPPLGDVSADTHKSPLRVNATLLSVDTEQVQQTINSDKPADELEREVRVDLGNALPKFVIRTLLLSVVIGLVVAAIASPRDLKALFVGALGSATVVGLLLGLTWRTYDVNAFEQPRYTGSLTEAPRVLAAVRKHVDGIDDVKQRLGTLSSQVSELYRTTSPAALSSEYQTSILHISDLHSNPVGIELAKRLAESFEVDGIIDTGDVTSFGLPVESRVGDLLQNMPAPYYVVPGNHDSPEIRQQLAQTKGITVLDNTTTDISGVQVLGIPDPTFTATNAISTQEATAQQRAAAPSVRSSVLAHPDVDVLAVHSELQAEESYGEVQLILAGHAHQRGVIVRNGSTGLVVGSTGAGGVGEFSTTENKSYEAEILHFDGDQLRAIDYVELTDRDGNFNVSRSVVPLSPIPANDKPRTEPDYDPAVRPTTTTSSTTTTTAP